MASNDTLPRERIETLIEELVMSLVEQQAMPDDSWKPQLAAIRSALSTLQRAQQAVVSAQDQEPDVLTPEEMIRPLLEGMYAARTEYRQECCERIIALYGTERTMHAAWRKRAEEAEAREDAMADAAEMLWVVLANVSGGDWTKQPSDWQEYAARWRDSYYAALTPYLAAKRQETPLPDPTREIP
jgi:hypothetical protein